MKSSVRNEILDQLVSLDEEVVNKALTKIRKNGDHTFVAPLLNTMAHTENELIASDIARLFFDLKDKPSTDVLLDLIKEDAYKEIRRPLLESIWQSGADVSHRINDVIDIAIAGDYLECLECMTIIENLETVPEERLLNESIQKIKDHQLEDMTEKEDFLWGMRETLEGLKK